MTAKMPDEKAKVRYWEWVFLQGDGTIVNPYIKEGWSLTSSLAVPMVIHIYDARRNICGEEAIILWAHKLKREVIVE